MLIRGNIHSEVLARFKLAFNCRAATTGGALPIDVGVNSYEFSQSTAQGDHSARKFADGSETLSMSPTSCDLITRGTVNAFTPAQDHHVGNHELKVRLISRLLTKAVQKSQADRGRTPCYAERSAQAAGLSYNLYSIAKVALGRVRFRP